MPLYELSPPPLQDIAEAKSSEEGAAAAAAGGGGWLAGRAVQALFCGHAVGTLVVFLMNS